MTREEARKWFQSHMTSDDMVNKAYRMAIEALSEKHQLSEETPTNIPTNTPTIVRCGDCKWHADGDESIASYCQNGDGLIGEVTDDMWCCYGERREP